MESKKSSREKTGPKIVTIRHLDKRKNIPTSELSKFVKKSREEEYKPTLYPRNPELDPQLVWKGKDQQDSQPLEVQNVPIYIHEKIHPQAIIDNLKKQSKGRKDQQEFNLFADFNGIEFEDLIDFYKHESNWTNRMILGDSLSVMNSLSERENLKGQVQCIYMDPPYGINFSSNWQTSTKSRDVKDGKTEDVVKEPEQIKAFRDTWELGINSFLSYMRDRLVIAHELISNSGSIFVQIGDENIHLVRTLMDEVFGPENFVAIINYKTMMPLESGRIESVYDYVIWYSKEIDSMKYRNLFVSKSIGVGSEFVFADDETSPNGYLKLEKEEFENSFEIMKTKSVFKRSNLSSSGYTPSCTFPITFKGEKFDPVRGKSWRTTKDGIEKLKQANRLFKLGNKLYYKLYFKDFGLDSLVNSWEDTISYDSRIYVVQTTPTVVQRCMLMCTDPGDLVLDPTCGSGTTAYVAEQWGRRWITIDTSRVALALARTRLMSSKFPYYLLADSKEGIQKEGEITGRFPPAFSTGQDIKKGFVYKHVPHVTLKSIANNPDIKPEMTYDEINTAILRHADIELLYDHPYEDNKRIRVTGPFTVESLSPHRVLDTDLPPRSITETTGDQEQENGSFEASIIENLRKAGIQNTKKHERLIFDSVETHSGSFIQAHGFYKDKSGKRKKVAISIGPKYGTISPEHVKQASIEAMKGPGCDLMVILGFAFGSYVSEEIKEYGDLTILVVRMNPDLMIGGDLLKKTGSGNLFTVFGEPDIDLKQKDGKYTVEIKGVDIYDPTTGEIRSSSPDETACWFIDTDYNEQSFFVRHAYFTGANDPYDKLRRALKAEIDEAAWSSLYSTKSRPFEKPESGKIAVKVINHYGDEVMKVFKIE